VGDRSHVIRPWVVWIAALAYLVAGIVILLLAIVVGTGTITWDVKGFLLTGWRLALFSSALGAVGGVGLSAALGLWWGSRWARPLAIGFWFFAGGLALVTDRSVAGPGVPLATYLVNMILVPVVVAAALLYGAPASSRYFRDPPRGPEP